MARKYLGSGRLTKKERRRKLNAGDPGTVVIMQSDGANIKSGNSRRGESFSSLNTRTVRGMEIESKAAASERKRASLKGSKAKTGALFEVGMRVNDTLAYDFDARLLVEYVQIALAAHLQQRMTYGQSAVDGSALPPIEPQTMRRKSRRNGKEIPRVNNNRAMRTGTLRDMWGMGPIKGNYHSATASVKPGGDKLDKGRSIFINAEIGRGIDYGAVTGDAGAVIAEAFEAFMDASKADAGGYVRVPREPRLAGGFVDPSERPLRTPKPSPGSPEDEGQ